MKKETKTNPISGIIMDMDGVIWRDTEMLVDLPDILSQMKEQGWRVMFMTNNSTKSHREYIDKLARMRVFLQSWQVINSAFATAKTLKNRYPKGGPLYIIGEKGLHTTLAEESFYHDENNPLAVVAGLDRDCTYDKIKTATLLINRGVPFIGTNPDTSFPSREGFTPGAGAILAAITAATRCEPEIIGKPSTIMFDRALEVLETAPNNTLMIGDRLETDILGGQNAGCQTALVLSGVTTAKEGARWSPVPTYIADDLTALMHTLTEQ